MGDAQKHSKDHSPSRIGAHLVHSLVTKLAKVVVGSLVFVEYAHTATVLPDTAFVALYKKTAGFFGDICSCLGVFSHWRAGIVLMTTNAAGDVPALYGVRDQTILECDMFLWLLGG